MCGGKDTRLYHKNYLIPEAHAVLLILFPEPKLAQLTRLFQARRNTEFWRGKISKGHIFVSAAERHMETAEGGVAFDTRVARIFQQGGGGGGKARERSDRSGGRMWVSPSHGREHSTSIRFIQCFVVPQRRH